MTGCSSVVTYSATSEVFPYPAGATTNVTPALSDSTSSRIDFREIKLGDGGGGTVRERFSPEITPGAVTRSLATPKGEALTAFTATQNHPIGVRKAGEIKGLRKLLRAPRAHPLTAHR